MEPIVVLPAQQLKEIIERYENAIKQLIDTQKELHALKSDCFVPLEWVADHWSVDIDTARKMVQVLSSGRPFKSDIKVLSYGRKIVRYRRSDIERFTNENLVPLKDMLARKQAIRVGRMNRVGDKE